MKGTADFSPAVPFPLCQCVEGWPRAAVLAVQTPLPGSHWLIAVGNELESPGRIFCGDPICGWPCHSPLDSDGAAERRSPAVRAWNRTKDRGVLPPSSTIEVRE